ncbi:MAG: hypothetical protein ACOYM3_09190 [Terrimicrobiaceae bacterium]
MHSNQKNILLAVAAAILVVGLIRLFWSDGLITLNFKDAPVAKVISSIERQGHVRIATNVAPETLVTIQMTRVPLMEALETLSVRIEGELRAAFVGAPTKAQAAAALEELKSGKPSDQWTVAWFPSMGALSVTTIPDPRTLDVKPEAGEKKDLQSALQQVALKSGIMTAVPRDWNPEAKMPAKTAPAAVLAKQLISSSGGQVQESFLIVVRENRDGGRGGPPGPGGPGGGDRAGQPGGDGGGQRFNRDGMNPEWMAQRAQAAIAQLPAEERPAAQADFDAMRKFWEEVRALPEDQRRPKMEEFFNRPEVQQKMEERQAASDARRTPEQREKRMKNYVERKKQMKAAAAQKP